MPKKGQLKDMDAWEQSIRDAAVYYTTIAFQPQKGQIPLQSFENLEHAKKYAELVIDEVTRYRSISVYAINEAGNHTLVGTVNQFKKEFKEVVPQRH
jgi:hypothetical protein